MTRFGAKPARSTIMVLYGKAGPAVFQQWVAVQKKQGEFGIVMQKVYLYTVSLPNASEALKKLTSGFIKQGPEMCIGVHEDLLSYLQKYGGAMKFDGELPQPPDTS